MPTADQYAKLVERINRVVRDRGDVEVMVLLDRIMDEPDDDAKAKALARVVAVINQNKKGSAGAQSAGSTT